MKIKNNFGDIINIHPDYEYDVDREVERGDNKTIDTIAENHIQDSKGKTVSQLWEEKTNKPWKEAKKQGITDGSYESNIELRKRLLKGNYNSEKEKDLPNENNSRQMNFREVFKAKRDELGPNKIFEFQGKPYNTAIKGEEFKPNEKDIKNYNLDKEKIEKQNKEVKSPYTSKEQVKLQPGYKNWESIKKRNKEINKMSNAEKIVQHHSSSSEEKENIHTVEPSENLSSIAKKYGVSVEDIIKENNISDPNKIDVNQQLKINSGKGKQYLIVDKDSSRMHLYRGDKLIDSFEVLLGKNKGDAQTVTKVDGKKTKWAEGNNSTGAGIYTISNTDPKSKSYYGLPSFNLKNEEGIEVATTIHGTPYKRRKFFDNDDVEDNRQSYGCINGKCTDLKDLYSKYGLGKGDKIYILPEDEGNEFIHQDGKIIFKASSKNRKESLEYTDSQGKTQKGQGINYTQKTLNYKPIKLFINKSEFEKNVYQSLDFNDDEEYEKTTKPFLESLKNNKKEVMKAAKVPSDIYNEIVKVAFGIYGTESNFGDTHSAVGNFGRAVSKYFDSDTSSPDYKSKYNTYNAKEDYRSAGLTQIRWKHLNKDEKEVLKTLGIKSNKDFLNPRKAALGTVAILSVRYNQQLTPEEKKDILTNLPKKWNNRENYSDRVKSNSRYLSIKQLQE